MLERILVSETAPAIQEPDPEPTAGKDEQRDQSHSAFLHTIEIAREQKRQERRPVPGGCDQAARLPCVPRNPWGYIAQLYPRHRSPSEQPQSENTATYPVALSTEPPLKCATFPSENSLPEPDPLPRDCQASARTGMAVNRPVSGRPHSSDDLDGSLTPGEQTARSAVEGTDNENLDHRKLDHRDSGFPESDCAAGMESALLAMPGSPGSATSGASGAEIRRSLQVDPAFLAMIEYASTSRSSSGEFEFQFALGSGAGKLARLQIAVTSLGRNRIGVKVRGRRHQGISTWLTGQLVEALREQGIDVVERESR